MVQSQTAGHFQIRVPGPQLTREHTRIPIQEVVPAVVRAQVEDLNLHHQDILLRQVLTDHIHHEVHKVTQYHPEAALVVKDLHHQVHFQDQDHHRLIVEDLLQEDQYPVVHHQVVLLQAAGPLQEAEPGDKLSEYNICQEK